MQGRDHIDAMTPEDYSGPPEKPTGSRWWAIFWEAVHWAAVLFALMCAILFFCWSLIVTAPPIHNNVDTSQQIQITPEL